MQKYSIKREFIQFVFLLSDQVLQSKQHPHVTGADIQGRNSQTLQTQVSP